MPGRRLAERAAFVSAVLGVAMGLLFLFAPIQGYCLTTATNPQPGVPATPAPTICGQESLFQAQPIWPMPFLAVVIWSLAPLLGYVGVRRRMAGENAGTALIVLAVVLEATVLISFGAAPFFAPFVLLPLVISTAFALASRVDQRRT
ncbi:MAG: hypothetical protein M3O80_09235 [Chloroflexota bacterium]|nr:hypothetical protein [Chloroflexota bacterium]